MNSSATTDYKIKQVDHEARDLCLSLGYEFECIPCGGKGRFKIGLLKNGEWIHTRERLWEYEEQDYALYESYRAMAVKILNTYGSKKK